MTTDKPPCGRCGCGWQVPATIVWPAGAPAPTAADVATATRLLKATKETRMSNPAVEVCSTFVDRD